MSDSLFFHERSHIDVYEYSPVFDDLARPVSPTVVVPIKTRLTRSPGPMGQQVIAYAEERRAHRVHTLPSRQSAR